MPAFVFRGGGDGDSQGDRFPREKKLSGPSGERDKVGPRVAPMRRRIHARVLELTIERQGWTAPWEIAGKHHNTGQMVPGEVSESE